MDHNRAVAKPLRRKPSRLKTPAVEQAPPTSPHIGWLWAGVGTALLGIVGGLALVVMGALQGDGPYRLSEGDFPGSVQLRLTERVETVVVYLEYPALGSAVEAPPYIGPIVTRDGQSVRVNNEPTIDPYQGLSTEMEPIGTFTGAPGRYEVAVNPGDGEGTATIVVGNPAESANGSSKIFAGSVGGTALFITGCVIAVIVGRMRQRSRQKLPVLVPPMKPLS